MMKETTLKARIISPGIAIGKPFWVNEPLIEVNETRKIDIDTEVKRFDKQVNRIASELSELFLRISKEIDIKNAEIIQTQQMILADEGFKIKVINLISEEFIPVEAAVERVMKSFSQRLAASSNEYMRERAIDFIDLATYFKNQSIEESGIPDKEIDKETILIVGELFPSIVLTCKRLATKGIIARSGAPTSHAAILARSFAIPVLVNALDTWEKIGNGDQIIVDAYDGNITLSPGPQTLKRYRKHLQEQKRLNKEYKAIKRIRAKTRDETRISLGVNIERLDELHLFSPLDIDELGLFRTEFLFMFDQTNFPSYEKQVKWYEKVVKYMDGKPVTFRALDVGGDKFLPYFSMGKQNNPYLGLRAHRVFRYHPEILETQLRAILQAAKFGPVRILYPMINNLEEMDYLNGILSGIETKDLEFELGIMVETPASVFMIRELIQHVDFVSIGTNDLVQYTLTVDRNNENVMPFYQPFHPLILRMLKKVVNAAKDLDKPVSICGEIASDPRWTPLLLGLGIRSLSMAPLLIPPIKKQILSLNLVQCLDLAEKALATNYEIDVERYLDDFFARKGRKKNVKNS
ncbi:MAG: phosphoenolpyruvate--protein phosphotransferase [Actinobacteria bacterium]|nr:phosphoenolpyruvate--protein phosphotransferase [Actinomycetota bacterium]